MLNDIHRLHEEVLHAAARLAAHANDEATGNVFHLDRLKLRVRELDAENNAKAERITALAREVAALTTKVSALELEVLRSLDGPTATDGERTIEEPIPIHSSDFLSFGEIDDEAFQSVAEFTRRNDEEAP